MKFSNKNIKRIVIKIGSNVLSDDKGIRKRFFSIFAKQVKFLCDQNIQPILVSSGAIAAGMAFLKDNKRPKSIPVKQAYAAIGQPLLMQTYAKNFSKQGLSIAQILLTQPSLENREHFLNAKHAIEALLKKNIIPIINENDSVVVDEIKVGDNDQLSAHVANLVEADLLVILSDIEGLYSANPKKDKNAKLLDVIPKVDEHIFAMVYQSQSVKSTGGMATKLLAAKISTEYGIPVVITSGFQKHFLQNIFYDKFVGTYFVPQNQALSSRKHWIGNIIKSKGSLIIDDGAKKALLTQKTSLLPSGIIEVQGKFAVGDCLEIYDKKQNLVAKGLSNYTSVELAKIKGAKTTQIEKILGYKNTDEAIDRDDLVLIKM